MRFLVVFAFVIGSEVLFAQHAVLMPGSFATVSIVDGKVAMTEKYTAMVPETRARTETYTVTVPTDGGVKTEVRTREVPYTVMIPTSRERVVATPKDYKVSLVNDTKIDKKAFEKKVKSHGKPLNVLLLNEGQELSKMEKSFFKDTAIILRRKVVAAPSIAPTRVLGSPYAPAPAYAPALPPVGFPVPAEPEPAGGSGEEDSSGSSSSGSSAEPSSGSLFGD